MSEWISVHKSLPQDGKQKYVIVHNIFQDRYYYATAFFTQTNRWGDVGGKVVYWMDAPEMPEEISGSHEDNQGD